MKLCYECRHMWITQAEAEWSELTPGQDFGMRCNKFHWRFDAYATNKQLLRDSIRTAQDCPDYDPDPDMVAIGSELEDKDHIRQRYMRSMQCIPRANFDRLRKGCCPDCNLELQGARNQECPSCHWSWPKSDGIYQYAVSSVAGDREWFYRIYQDNHLLEQSSAGSVEQAKEIAKYKIERYKIERLNGIDLGATFTAMNRRISGD